MKFEFIELSNEKVYFFKRIFDLIKKFQYFLVILVYCLAGGESGRVEESRVYKAETRPPASVSMRFPELCLACSPLSLPSLYLTYRLVRRRFLHTVFNQHFALMFLVTGSQLSLTRTVMRQHL